MPQVGIEGWNKQRRAEINAEIGELRDKIGALLGASSIPLIFGVILITERHVGGYFLCAIAGVLIACATKMWRNIVALKKSAKRDMTW